MYFFNALYIIPSFNQREESTKDRTFENNMRVNFPNAARTIKRQLQEKLS